MLHGPSEEGAVSNLASHKEEHGVAGKEKTKEESKATEGSKKPEAREVTTKGQGESPEKATSETREKELELLRKSLQEEKDRAEQYLSSLKYLKAEFENYQKRTAREMDELIKRGSERLARKLLSVVDDFERTIMASKAVGDQSKLLTASEMILKELLKILKSEGIAKIEALGKKFNPELHEAVTVNRTDKSPPDTVVEELRPGYMFEGRVLRPSMVAVANPPDKQGNPDSEKKEKGEDKRETSNSAQAESSSEE
jgi:molecular chaperone GrpE